MSTLIVPELMFKLPPSPFIRELPNKVNLGLVPGVIYDLGCGTGRNSRFLARLGHNIVGVSVSHDDIIAAEQMAMEDKLTNCKFFASDVRNMTFPEKAGGIIINEVLHEMPLGDAKKVLESARKATMQGGFHAISGYLARSGNLREAGYLLTNQLIESYETDTSSDWRIIEYQEGLESSCRINGQEVERWQATIIAQAIAD